MKDIFEDIKIGTCARCGGPLTVPYGHLHVDIGLEFMDEKQKRNLQGRTEAIPQKQLCIRCTLLALRLIEEFLETGGVSGQSRDDRAGGGAPGSSSE